MADFELPPKRFAGNDNPFAAPESDFNAAPASTSDLAHAERIRNEHIGAEASVRSIGTLYFITSFLILTFFGITIVLTLIDSSSVPMGPSEGVILLLIGFAQFFLGRGLRNLKNWARITAAILSIPGILNPIIWLILYCLLNKKAVYVCTPEYAQIREMTPHIKYKTSIVVKILLGLLLVVFLVIMAGLISGSIQ